jgi:hypothetical protein
MPELLPVQLRRDLTLVIGRSRATLTPTQGLRFSEELARASFRRALTEDAEALAPDSNGHHAGCEIAEKLSDNCTCAPEGVTDGA